MGFRQADGSPVTVPPRPNPGHVPPRTMTTAEVAAMFSVAMHAVRRWARRGLVTSSRDTEGNLRYPADEVRALLAAGTTVVAERPAGSRWSR